MVQDVSLVLQIPFQEVSRPLKPAQNTLSEGSKGAVGFDHFLLHVHLFVHHTWCNKKVPNLWLLAGIRSDTLYEQACFPAFSGAFPWNTGSWPNCHGDVHNLPCFRFFEHVGHPKSWFIISIVRNYLIPPKIEEITSWILCPYVLVQFGQPYLLSLGFGKSIPPMEESLNLNSSKLDQFVEPFNWKIPPIRLGRKRTYPPKMDGCTVVQCNFLQKNWSPF